MLALVQFISCDPEKELSGETTYNFSINSSISPSSDTINIGDTLYLISSFPSQLRDTKTGSNINYSHSKAITSSIGFNDFSKLGTNTDSSTTKYFNFFTIVGDVYNDKTLPVYWQTNVIKYEEKNDGYYLKIGMIPKKSGIYAFGIANLGSAGQIGNKNDALFLVTFTHTNQHLYYYEDQFGQLSDHDRGGAYCFVVR